MKLVSLIEQLLMQTLNYLPKIPSLVVIKLKKIRQVFIYVSNLWMSYITPCDHHVVKSKECLLKTEILFSKISLYLEFNFLVECICMLIELSK